MKAEAFSDQFKLQRALQKAQSLPRLLLVRCKDPKITEEIHAAFLTEVQRRNQPLPVEDIRLNGLDCKLNVLHAEIATMPMFDAARCIFLRHADGILRELDKAAKHEETKNLLAYFERDVRNLPESTSLVIQTEDKKIPSSVSFFEQTDWIFEEKELRERDLAAFLLTRAKTMGYEIAIETAEFLAEKSAFDSRMAIHSLDQLFIFKLHDKKITRDDIAALVTDSEGELQFQVVDEIARRNIPAALQKFMQTKPDEGPKTLGLWLKLFSDYTRYQGYVSAGIAPQEALAVLGVAPFRFSQVEDKFRRMAQLYPGNSVTEILDRFVEYDRRLKENNSAAATRDLLVNFLLSLSP